MKKMVCVLGLVLCMFCMAFTVYAKDGDAQGSEAADAGDEKAAYEEAISDNYKEMLKNSIKLDKLNAGNTESLLAWQDVKDPPEEAKKKVKEILELADKQEEEQENMGPYTKAKKTCDKKLNADGANAALKNIIRIQKDQIADKEELAELWKKVDKMLKGKE